MRPVLPVLAFILVAGCSSANGESRDNANGPATTRGFNATGFDGVALAASDDVQVVRGDKFSVVAMGSEKVLDKLSITVDGTTLKIGRKRGNSWLSWGDHDSAKITVTLPVLYKAVLAGSGNLRVDTTSPERFEATLAGSGNLDVAQLLAQKVDLVLAGSGNLTAKGAAAATLDASIAGSGNIDVSGVAKSATLEIAGSGDLEAEDLASDFADASIAGSGNIRVRVTGKAKASIIGSGNIDIAGTKDCAISKRGSGEVRCTT